MKHMVILCALWIVAVFMLPLVPAAMLITGYVNDSLDGTRANDHVVVLWQPEIGIQDNITTLIGPLGPAGQNNLYLLDCELLQHACAAGDVLALRVMDTGDHYATAVMSISVTAPVVQIVPMMQLKAPPRVLFPQAVAERNATVTLSCAARDVDEDLALISFYGEWPTSLAADQRVVAGGEAAANFTVQVPDGVYYWRCAAIDRLNTTSSAVPASALLVDTTPPAVEVTRAFGSATVIGTYVRIACRAQDKTSGIRWVTVKTRTPSGMEINYTTAAVNRMTYATRIKLMELGTWSFRCIASDNLNNTAESAAPIQINVRKKHKDEHKRSRPSR